MANVDDEAAKQTSVGQRWGSWIRQTICELFGQEGASIAIGDLDKPGGRITFDHVRILGANSIFIPVMYKSKSR